MDLLHDPFSNEPIGNAEATIKNKAADIDKLVEVYKLSEANQNLQRNIASEKSAIQEHLKFGKIDKKRASNRATFFEQLVGM